MTLSSRNEIDAFHIQVEANIDQIEGDIRANQHEQDALLLKMHKASRRGNTAKLEALARLHGNMVAVGLKYHDAVRQLRALLKDTLDKSAAHLAQLDNSLDA